MITEQDVRKWAKKLGDDGHTGPMLIMSDERFKEAINRLFSVTLTTEVVEVILDYLADKSDVDKAYSLLVFHLVGEEPRRMAAELKSALDQPPLKLTESKYGFNHYVAEISVAESLKVNEERFERIGKSIIKQNRLSTKMQVVVAIINSRLSDAEKILLFIHLFPVGRVVCNGCPMEGRCV